ncbi:MAG TPA: hypothetical protein VFU69_05350, partial [Ktedonobacterales bacterium]|nr:hypothetical protein [Ktedonobacterales bacterium]
MFRQEEQQVESKPRQSWGEVMARLIEHHRVPQQPEEVLEYVVRLRDSVYNHRATWYDLTLLEEQQPDVELLKSIAADAKLPAQFGHKQVGNVADLLSVGLLLSGLFIPPVVSVALGLGTLA